ncbi:MAG: hypothetical protein AABX72_01730 [Nanoarchaeota archaeon]
MTLEEKIKRVAAVIDEALTVQKTNPVYIPDTYFSHQSLGFPTPKDVFRVLRENGAIKKIEGWWGYDEIKKDGRQVFVKTSTDEAVTDEDYSVYAIEIDEKKWVAGKKFTKGSVIKAAAVLDDWIFNEEGRLYSKSSTKKTTKFGKDTGRYKILNALVDAGGKLVSTDDLREISGKETNRAVQKEIGMIKKRIAKLLGIKDPKKDEIIEGIEYSGYKLLIKIRKLK